MEDHSQEAVIAVYLNIHLEAEIALPGFPPMGRGSSPIFMSMMFDACGSHLVRSQKNRRYGQQNWSVYLIHVNDLKSGLCGVRTVLERTGLFQTALLGFTHPNWSRNFTVVSEPRENGEQAIGRMRRALQSLDDQSLLARAPFN